MPVEKKTGKVPDFGLCEEAGEKLAEIPPLGSSKTPRSETDVRMMALSWDATGRWTGDFVDSVARFTMPGWDDFAVEGPPTACWCTDVQASHEGSAIGYQSRWRADLRRDPEPPGVQETLSRIVDTAAIYDLLHRGRSWPAWN